MAPRDRRPGWLSHGVLPGFLWLAGVFLFETTDLDLAASDPFFDFEARQWTWAGAWWSNELLHTGGKWLVVLIATGALALLLLSLVGPRLARRRRVFLYIVLCIGLSTGLTALGKEVTDRHCPREMTRYGGRVPYTRLFEGTPAGHSRGECFPAGHASGALALFCLYFVARQAEAPRPALWLLPALSLGATFALAQQVRGAHFLSHNLWTAGLCWFVALVLAPVLPQHPDA